MNLEWADEALADLDRFAEFLVRDRPSLAAIVAGEIIDKVKVLSAHPQLGRPIAGREEHRQLVLQFLARPMCSNTATMEKAWSCYACFMAAKRESKA